jgi:energy-coupling factor transporter ATP-binding protein EcfA2
MSYQTQTTEIEGVKLDLANEEFNNAVDFVQHTGKIIYLTGKAGTGKTTFLKYIKATIKKNTVILAPTGVAAVNAGGQTIHSFFKIRPSVYVPGDKRLRARCSQLDSDQSTIYDNFQYNKNKLSIIRGLEILIIDEISMVRCDLLDVVDRILRVFRKREKEAFGGVQVILIGDTFQLPPIAQNPEWEILKQFYENPFFFSSRVMKESKPVYIELKKIYRQKEQEFIDLLNRVRVNQVTQNDISILNSKFNPVFSPKKNENYVILATHNDMVRRTNLTKLEELPGELNLFNATVDGDFPDAIMPTDRVLQLKEDAQIMFIKNDMGKRYYNGKIAKIVKIDEAEIVAELSEGNQIIVEREKWENIKYVWNDKKKKIEEEVVGTFVQYPVKLAWAITVHKSQGLTFEKVIADLESAFAPGQVYVALSRCVTFNGLVLRTQLHKNAIKTAPEVLVFAQNEMPSTLIAQELNSGKADFYYKKVREALKQLKFEEAYDMLIAAIKYRNDMETEVFKRCFCLLASRQASYKKGYDSAQNAIAQNADLLVKNDELKKQAAEQANKISEQNKAIKLLLDTTGELENSNENQKREIEQLKKNNAALSKSLKSVSSKVAECEGEIELLRSEIVKNGEAKWYRRIVGKR